MACPEPEHCHLFPSGEKVVGVSLVPWVLEPPLAVLLGLQDGLHFSVAGRPVHLLFCRALLCCPICLARCCGRESAAG